jgi:Tol biopolymer transport system component
MSSPPARSPQRRSSDLVRRHARVRRALTTVAITAVLTIVFGGYWWYRDRAPARDGAPGWSPDSQSIVFSSEVGTSKGDLFIMKADGSDRQPLVSDAANEGSPAMSPDGRRLAFESDRDGNVEIYVMDLGTKAIQRLTHDPAEDRSPAWSPDGSRIAFTSDRGGRASADLYTMKADGSDVQRLSTTTAHWAPQYSPDGTMIAFQQDRDVQILDLATGASRQLTSDPQNGMNPTWSPDGRRLAFVTTRNGKAEIFAMQADGTGPAVLVSIPRGNVIDPRWSPDGTRVAFVLVPDEPDAASGSSVQAIYTIELESGTLTRLSR